MYTVYKHTAPNNKVYIGITLCDIKDRWKNGYGYKRNDHFFRAIKLYGWDNIKHEILFEGLTKEEDEKKEIEYIAKYKSSDKRFGYNSTNGGECIGKHTEETIKKIKQAIKGKRHSQTELTKEKIRKSHLGYKHSKEAIEKMRKAKLGNKATEETRKKMSLQRKGEKAWNYGKHLTEETKEKIRKSRLGFKHSEETKKKMSEQRKGGNNPNAKRIELINENGEILKIYNSSLQAQKDLNISKDSITAVLKGRKQQSKGYIFRYALNTP